MLYERAEVLVKDGLEEEFLAAMNERGLAILSSTEGVESVRLGRGVENPDKFMLLVHWRSMEDHLAFRDSPGNAQIRELIGGFSKGGGMEHFEID